MNAQKTWQLDAWQLKPTAQPIIYPDSSQVNYIIQKLSHLPPLVTAFEIEILKAQLAEAAAGKCFLLQAGDCAESFADCTAESINNKLKILLEISLILSEGLNKPVIQVGRLAGQYAKPRSAEMETQNEITLPSYRGDLINRPGFSLEERTPDSQLMLQGYYNSALTLNYIRALVDSHFYVSHEALHLLYEQALTRQEKNGRWYNLSTHFPWIGMRTADPEQSHIEYIRGIANPIAIKISSNVTPERLTALVDILNPTNEPGRLTLIHRLGAQRVSDSLPRLIETVQKTGKTVLWCCDPMHGNTSTTSTGIKTRRFDDILFELQQSFSIHQNMNSYLGGVHFELTGENVTECIGGAQGLSETDLAYAYKSLLDPRLNYEQALEIAMLIVRESNHVKSEAQ